MGGEGEPSPGRDREDGDRDVAIGVDRVGAIGMYGVVAIGMESGSLMHNDVIFGRVHRA